jgi:chemotaxis protein MotB
MAAKKKQTQKAGIKIPEFMVSYADMMTLLFVFFVLMMGDPVEDPRQTRLMLSAFTGSFGVYPGGMSLSQGNLADMGMTVESLPSVDRGTSLARSKRDAQEILQPEIRARQVRVHEDQRGIAISLAADSFFSPGSAELNLDRASELLRKVAQLARATDHNSMAIEGHTDDTPIAGNIFRNNWELSSARALAVLVFLAGEGVPEERMRSVAYAEHKRIESNDTPEGRAYNRRVDIILMRD